MHNTFGYLLYYLYCFIIEHFCLLICHSHPNMDTHFCSLCQSLGHSPLLVEGLEQLEPLTDQGQS